MDANFVRKNWEITSSASPGPPALLYCSACSVGVGFVREHSQFSVQNPQVQGPRGVGHLQPHKGGFSKRLWYTITAVQYMVMTKT